MEVSAVSERRSMSFTFRLCVSYGILFVGSQVVYFGMKFNGGAYQKNPMWHFVNGVHSILTYGTLFFLGAVLLATIVSLLVSAPIPQKQHTELIKIESPPLDLISDEMIENERREQKKLEAEQQSRQIEELRQKQIIEKRRNRSAEEAARSALDDFL